VGHDRAFLGEALDVFGFLREITQGNKKRKNTHYDVRLRETWRLVAAACFSQNAETPWADNHAAPRYIGRLGQFRRSNGLFDYHSGKSSSRVGEMAVFSAFVIISNGIN